MSKYDKIEIDTLKKQLAEANNIIEKLMQLQISEILDDRAEVKRLQCIVDTQKKNNDRLSKKLLTLKHTIQTKDSDVEVQLYNEYEDKLKQMKEYFTTKIDEFVAARTIRELRQMEPREILERAIAGEFDNLTEKTKKPDVAAFCSGGPFTKMKSRELNGH